MAWESDGVAFESSQPSCSSGTRAPTRRRRDPPREAWGLKSLLLHSLGSRPRRDFRPASRPSASPWCKSLLVHSLRSRPRRQVHLLSFRKPNNVLELFQIANGRWPQGFELDGSERLEANRVSSSARHHEAVAIAIESIDLDHAFERIDQPNM